MNLLRPLVRNFTIMQLFGVPVKINIITIIYLAGLAFLMDMPLLYSFCLIYVTFMFLIVGHEFAHILTARHFGHKCEVVYLTIAGGAALIPTGNNLNAKEEFFIAAAGPAFNVILAPFLYLLGWEPLLLINLVMIIFNLIPFYPMDGGRITKAMLSIFVKNEITLAYILFYIALSCFVLFIWLMIVTHNPVYLLLGSVLLFMNWHHIRQAKETTKA